MAFGVLFLVAPGAASAQATAGSGVMQSNVPVFASGVMLPTVPGEDELPANLLKGSVTVGANYDDNVFPNVSPRQWDVDYSVRPAISFTETRPRLEWNLDYSPGIEISQQYFFRNIFAQRLGANFIWRATPHGTFSGEQDYLVTTDPFAGVTTTSPVPTIAPNETIYVPNVRQTWLLTHLLYSYRTSAQTTMGVGGTYSLQWFDTIPKSGPTTALIHAQVASGEAFIARKLTAQNQLGFQYGAQVLRFPAADARTTTHSFLIFDQMNFSDHNVLTLYGGPEYSLTHNEAVLNLGFVVVTLPVNANEWTGSGGVMYNWTGNRMAASIDVSRRVSEGGALVGAVELTSGKLNFIWQLTRNWSVTSALAGADDQLLAATSASGSELRTYSGQVGFRRELVRNLGLNWYYERLDETGSLNGFLVGNRDILGASLDYSFLRPVGR